eukprot:Gb_31047 [translate_table: standard]
MAEKKNRTIMEMARSMLKSKNLPNDYRAEAVATTLYILNCSPTKSVKNITPKEAWSSHNPLVTHFRVFGCVAYVHIPNKKWKKMDVKSQLCIFVGYSEETKGYRFYNPITKQLIVSQDVLFNEGGVWQWKEGVQKEKPVIEEIEDDIIPPPPTSSSGSSSSPSSPSSGGSSFLPSRTTQSSPSASSPSSESPLRKVRNLSDIYQRTTNMNQVVNFALLSPIQVEPTMFEEATKNQVWIDAMNEEIEAIHRNNTWELVQLPKDKYVIGVKWIYKVKYHADGSVEQHKARLVAKGFAQTPGVDYSETFAPMARLNTIKIVLEIVAQHKWIVSQMDVKSAFLNGYIDEEVYVEQPTGYAI